MILVRLLGGLGNQMFQYAVGRALSVRNKCELKLDISFLEDKSRSKDFTIREYELDAFNISPIFASAEEVDSYLHKSFIQRQLRFFDQKKVIHEDLSNSTLITFTHKHMYLNGYWQTEAYFESIKDLIRKDFTFKLPLTGENESLANKINHCHAVAVHIRRGDYAMNETVQKVHGVLPPSYYEAATNYVMECFNDAHFFVFSDDIGWVQQHITFPGKVTFISHNTGKNSYLDMQLMSLCNHNIIANSSFSWWGAWLNSNTDKKVIAPLKWFTDPSRETQHILPQNWIKF